MPSQLRGPLYFISLLSAATVALIGLTFILYAPQSGPLIFGIPIPSTSTLSLSSAANTGLTAYISVIGVRDLTLAFVSFIFTLLRDRRAVGVVLAGGLFATVGDAAVMMAYSDDPFFFTGAHLVTGVPMIGLMLVLLIGSNAKDERLMR